MTTAGNGRNRYIDCNKCVHLDEKRFCHRLNYTVKRTVDRCQFFEPREEAWLSLKTIPVNKLRPSPFNIRVDITPEEIAELARSIVRVGQVEAITVRPSEGGYEIVTGERRWRALEEATAPAWRAYEGALARAREALAEALARAEGVLREAEGR